MPAAGGELPGQVVLDALNPGSRLLPHRAVTLAVAAPLIRPKGESGPPCRGPALAGVLRIFRSAISCPTARPSRPQSAPP